MKRFKKHLSAPGLINATYKLFQKVPDPRQTKKNSMPIVDHLMSGLAIFGLKCTSLLEFEEKMQDIATAHNLKTLYHVDHPPSDTYLRERLDEVSPNSIRSVFKALFSICQRGKLLEEFTFLDGHVLLSGDGTGLFASSKISCPQCCCKQTKNGTFYYHQMFAVALVHPDKRHILPLCPELILNQDGNDKNDCERNACKRFLENFRREHPHLKAILLEDGLSSTAPNIRMIEEHNLKYLLVAKPGDHRFLFEQIEEREDVVYHEITTEDGSFHQFRFLNQVSLNKSNQDLLVNFLEYRVTNSKGKELHLSWVTNIYISKDNVLKISVGGRARWKVENETFNTLKNLGYHFEHNYGHGKQYLSTIFCMLMMTAFLIDQIQGMACDVFQGCKTRLRTYRELWETMRALFRLIKCASWEDFYSLMLKEELVLDTS